MPEMTTKREDGWFRNDQEEMELWRASGIIKIIENNFVVSKSISQMIKRKESTTRISKSSSQTRNFKTTPGKDILFV